MLQGQKGFEYVVRMEAFVKAGRGSQRLNAWIHVVREGRHEQSTISLTFRMSRRPFWSGVSTDTCRQEAEPYQW